MKTFLHQLAADLKIDPSEVPNIPTTSGNEVLANGLTLVYMIAGTIAVITIIVAGIMFATSSGDPGNVTKAKNLLLFALIGIVVIALAFTITQIVIGRATA